MPTKGRPRLTPEELEARIAAYCARYAVTATAEGLPPFPSGKRETPQHRDWISVYKAHQRLARRRRGQCERCDAPAGPGSVFCEAHRSAGGSTATGPRHGLCPTCGQEWPKPTNVGPKSVRKG